MWADDVCDKRTDHPVEWTSFFSLVKYVQLSEWRKKRKSTLNGRCRKGDLSFDLFCAAGEEIIVVKKREAVSHVSSWPRVASAGSKWVVLYIRCLSCWLCGPKATGLFTRSDPCASDDNMPGMSPAKFKQLPLEPSRYFSQCIYLHIYIFISYFSWNNSRERGGGGGGSWPLAQGPLYLKVPTHFSSSSIVRLVFSSVKGRGG